MGYLSFIVAVPFITALVIMFTPEARDRLIKQTALVGTGIILVSSIYLAISYLGSISGLTRDELYRSTPQLEYFYSVPWFSSLNVNYTVGVDGISVAMILLTAIVIFCGVLASWGLKSRVKEFFCLLMVLVTGVLGVFISIDLFLLFLFYEVAVLPMYLLIGVWGTGPKEYSAMKLTLMLLAGSALILVGILALYFGASVRPFSSGGSFNIVELAQHRFPVDFQFWVFPCLFVGFGVIGALFPLHTWSPDGHSSAPTAVSMLHAGVLMKLGGYGCLRAVYMLPEGAKEWAVAFMLLATINIIYGGFVAIQKKDLKYITAYSSVSHCGFVLFGLMALTIIGIQGAVLQMFSHGVMTALFFALVGMIYERTKTRDIREMGGLMQVTPVLGVCYFIAGLAALGLPGLAGFVAEITIFVGAWARGDMLSRGMTVVACASIVVAAVYILRALAQIFFGEVKNAAHQKLTDANFVEKLSISVLAFVLVFVGLFPGWLIKMIEYSLGPVMANLARSGAEVVTGVALGAGT